MWYGRNFEKRIELQKQLKELEEYAYSDEHCEEDYDDKIRALNEKITALEYPITRNKWFCEFVKSFGIRESKRVTYRQAKIFERYCERSHSNHYTVINNSYARVDDLFVKLEPVRNSYYVTIRQVVKDF